MEDLVYQLRNHVRMIMIGTIVLMCALLFVSLRLKSDADGLADRVRVLERNHKALQDQVDTEHEDLNYQIVRLQEQNLRLQEQLKYRGKTTWL